MGSILNSLGLADRVGLTSNLLHPLSYCFYLIQ